MYVDSVYLYIDDKINELKHVFCKVTSYYSYQIKEAEQNYKVAENGNT